MPACPDRPIYGMTTQHIRELPEAERKVTPEERQHYGECHIVAGWEDFQELTPTQRTERGCVHCPVYTQELPPSIPIFRKAIRHLHLHQINLAPPYSDYTPREVAAIAFVHNEIERAGHKKGA
jgi:hypothetical protein